MCDRTNECCVKPNLSAGIPMDCNIRSCCPKVKHCHCAKSFCYKQPLRVQSFKPITNYSRPTEQMECSTIYNRSYFPIGNCISRVKPIYPSNNLHSLKGPQDMNTIQKMSYQAYCNVPRTQPILPAPNSMSIREGPQYMMTTQKHDYVAKSVRKAQPILPCHNIDKTRAPLEKLTINKLSFMPIDVNKFPRPKPIIPESNCGKPVGPTENMTIQKLSYMPVSILPKEDLPWKNPSRTVPPPYPCNQGTTYSLSYMPNCNIKKAQPCLPNECARLFGAEISKPCTIYNLSYMTSNNKPSRVQPIKPVPNLVTPQGPLESCTVYKLSYLPNASKRTLPILPITNQMKSNESMSKITTQKHDFTAKPYSKPSPIIRSQNIPRLAGQTEQNTINRLSYMPFDVSKIGTVKTLKPAENPKCLPPLSSFTTYKLSYMPQNITEKETFPWQQKPKYNKPTLPLECLTIQKLSYMPPGNFDGQIYFSTYEKKKTTNNEQFQLLVQEMKKNPDIARSFSKNKTQQEISGFWDKLGSNLNALGLPRKTAKEWRKVWTDYKAFVKRKLSHNRKETTATGGGPNKKIKLTQQEEDVAEILNLNQTIVGVPGSSFGCITTNVEVPAVPADDEEILIEEMFESVESNSPMQPTTPAFEPITPRRTARQSTSAVATDAINRQIELQEKFYKSMNDKLDRAAVKSEEICSGIKRIYRALEKNNDIALKKLKMEEAMVEENNKNKKLETEKIELEKKLIEMQIFQMLQNDANN